MLDKNSMAPKYHQLKEYLKKAIMEGKFAPEEQLPSENQMAREHKLSRHTVRQALGELENEGLVYREQGRGTFCSINRGTANSNIVLLTTYISDYIFPEIIKGIEEILSISGRNLILANTNNDKNKEAQILENILKQEVAGFIIEPTKSAYENTNLRYFLEIERRNIPYIMIHAVYPGLDPAQLILEDEKGEYLITQYLLQLGHRQIAGLFKTDDLQGVKRQTGYFNAMADYKVDINPEFIGIFETEQYNSYPYYFTQNLLRKSNRPTAIVCYNDIVALKALEAIRDAGLRVPEDLSLVGYDDSSLAVATEVKLTTVKHPQIELGHQAGRLILEMVEGKIQKPHLVFQPELIIRNSCRGIN
ncbi:MAG TPA: GntR family transcriptional regulator [Bacillota bacterium]|nr:GntR family transcriptional regulator [Bacillota bacterium]